MAANSVETAHLARARWAVLTMFFLNGAIFANWVARIPQIQNKLGLGEGQLGLVLLGIAVGVLSALTITSGLISRYGSRRVTWVACFANGLLLPVLALASNAAWLWGALFVFGMTTSAMDVAMNAQAVEVEAQTERALMSSFHAAWSIGGFVGAGLGAGFAFLQVGPLVHFAVAGWVLLVPAAYMGRFLVVTAPVAEDDAENVFQFPVRAAWPLGAVVLASALGEGAMADWSAIYLSKVVGTEAGLAALGFASFSITMTIGRLAGDSLVGHFSVVKMVRYGGGLAAAGLLLAILFPQVPTTLLGFAAAGLGLSVVVPLAFSAAGRLPGLPAGTGIASVATIGYAAFLAGPPIIGLVAEVSSLRVAMLLVTLVVGTLLMSARALYEPHLPANS